MKQTATGRAIRAVAQNWPLAQICGVDPNAAIRRAFAFGGALAGAAAFVFALYYTRPFGNHGAQSGLLAFTAAILGGIGSPGGALLSALLLGAVSSFSDYYLAAQWTPALLQMLLIGLLVWRPTGFAAAADSIPYTATEQRDSITAALAGSRPAPNRKWIGVGIGLALLFPLLDYALGLNWQVLLTGIGILMLLALGLNLLLGVAGILDLGYAVSFGIGGYFAAMLTNRQSQLWPQPLDFMAVALLTMFVCGALGWIKGRLTLRLRSDYLAVVTLALGLLARRSLINLSSLTGGVGGLAALPPPTLFTIPIIHLTAQYYLIFGAVILTASISQQLIRSHLGRAWLAAGEDETAAAASGVDVAGYKSLAVLISSAIAGLAGALYAATFAYVSPDMVDFHISALVLAMVILGGAGNVPGAIIGALVVAGYDRLIVPRLGDLIAALLPLGLSLGYAPDIRGASYFNFGLALYLTVRLRAGRQ